MILSCKKVSNSNTFAQDVEALKQVKDLTVLSNGDAMIAVSGAYQGRVFTSSSKGMKGNSYGYFNKALINEGNAESNLSSLGGESRMWFGPQFGEFSIFFEPNTNQVGENIVISPDLDSVLFQLIEKKPESIVCGNTLSIRNSNAYVFKLDAKRKISLKTTNQIETELQITLNEKLSSVAFSTETWIKNIGKVQWKKENGLLSIWDLSCENTSSNTVVAIPTRNKIDAVVNYFTALDESRYKIKNNVVFYKADAEYMNKIGILPNNCLEVFGSYTTELKLLTIVKYHFEDAELYANSLPDNTEPYKGDVINIFNGEVNKALDRNWPFYELETSSAMKELYPNEALYHSQTIYHFEGDKDNLNQISTKVLGIQIEDFKI